MTTDGLCCIFLYGAAAEVVITPEGAAHLAARDDKADASDDVGDQPHDDEHAAIAPGKW